MSDDLVEGFFGDGGMVVLSPRGLRFGGWAKKLCKVHCTTLEGLCGAATIRSDSPSGTGEERTFSLTLVGDDGGVIKDDDGGGDDEKASSAGVNKMDEDEDDSPRRVERP